MSDRLVEDDEVFVDETKEQAIAKHNSDIEVMTKLINAIDEYLIRFAGLVMFMTNVLI